MIRPSLDFHICASYTVLRKRKWDMNDFIDAVYLPSEPRWRRGLVDRGPEEMMIKLRQSAKVTAHSFLGGPAGRVASSSEAKFAEYLLPRLRWPWPVVDWADVSVVVTPKQLDRAPLPNEWVAFVNLQCIDPGYMLQYMLPAARSLKVRISQTDCDLLFDLTAKSLEHAQDEVTWWLGRLKQKIRSYSGLERAFHNWLPRIVAESFREHQRFDEGHAFRVQFD